MEVWEDKILLNNIKLPQHTNSIISNILKAKQTVISIRNKKVALNISKFRDY